MKILKVTKENEHYYSLDFIRGYNLGATQQAEIMPERKRGEWMSVSDETQTWYHCSECHYQQYGKTKFCPNCGARMVKEGEEHD